MIDTSWEDIAADMLARTENITLASLDQGGFPRPVPMNRLSHQGLRTVWMTTEYSGEKVRHFLRDPRAGLCFYTERGSVSLTGEVEVLREPSLLESFWQEGFRRYFPQGASDPQYCLLRFTALQGKGWIDGSFHAFRWER